MKYPYRFTILVLSSFFLFSCQHIKKSCAGAKKARHYCKSGNKSHCQYKAMAGVAMIKDVNGNKIKGTVSFSASKKEGEISTDTKLKSKKAKHCSKSKDWEVQVKAKITGLEPNKKFGFHVHEFGTCENKALMAGGHLNPWGSKHGASKGKERHLGDLGNLVSNDKGIATYSETIKGSLKMFMGRSVIIHAKADDLKSQPSGKSGQRIACGIIGVGLAPASAEKQEAGTKKQEATTTQKASTKKQEATAQKASTKKQEVTVQKASTKKQEATTTQKASTKKQEATTTQKASTKKQEATTAQKASTKKQEATAQKAKKAN